MNRILLCTGIILLLCLVGCKKDADPCHTPVVAAGDDITLTGETSVTLNGTTTEAEGTWTIVTGTGGEITNGNQFTGELKTVYTLKWASTNGCGSAEDFLTITLNVSCGVDQTIEEMVDNIHWIEQSCFRIEGSSLKIYTDPNSITEEDEADIILITHAHNDHYTTADLDKISGSKTIIIAPADVIYAGTQGQRINLLPGDEYTAFGCVVIKAVPAYNIVKTYHPQSMHWVGYLITVNGVTIYISGDTDRIPEMQNITCDIAILPLGQTYTFDSVQDAADAAQDVSAEVVIPMHYGLAEGTPDDAEELQDLLDGIIPVVIKVKGN